MVKEKKIVWVDIYYDEELEVCFTTTQHVKDKEPDLLYKAGAADSYVGTYPVEIELMTF